jgi:flagellar biosynthesis GTPase FlhF
MQLVRSLPSTAAPPGDVSSVFSSSTSSRGSLEGAAKAASNLALTEKNTRELPLDIQDIVLALDSISVPVLPNKGFFQRLCFALSRKGRKGAPEKPLPLTTNTGYVLGHMKTLMTLRAGSQRIDSITDVYTAFTCLESWIRDIKGMKNTLSPNSQVFILLGRTGAGKSTLGSAMAAQNLSPSRW